MNFKTKPQVRIPSHIFEKILLSDISLIQIRIILFVIRFQFGFNRLKKCVCAQFDFNCLGIHASDISRELNNLINKKIIIKRDNLFLINEFIDDWDIQQKTNSDEARFLSLLTLHATSQSKLDNTQ